MTKAPIRPRATPLATPLTSYWLHCLLQIQLQSLPDTAYGCTTVSEEERRPLQQLLTSLQRAYRKASPSVCSAGASPNDAMATALRPRYAAASAMKE